MDWRLELHELVHVADGRPMRSARQSFFGPLLGGVMDWTKKSMRFEAVLAKSSVTLD